MAARLASGMPPGLGPGARAAILSEAEAKERAAPEKKKVGMAAAREAAMSGARGDVMEMMDRLAYHLAQVVGSWCGRLAGQEEEQADRGAARGPGPHGAPCEAGARADVSGASGEATGGDDDGDASMYKLQTCRARRARE